MEKRFLKSFIKFTIFIVIFIFSISPISASINFSISNPTINENDEIEVDATISGLISSSCSTTGCYLQAELQSSGGCFGYTYNNSGEFVDYFKTPSSTDEIKTKLFNFIPASGAWSGKLKAKNSASSQNYYGPGDYILSFRRFSGNSLTATSTDSNSISVSLKMPTPTPTPTTTPSPSMSTITPTPTSTTFTLKTPLPSQSLTPTPKPLASINTISTGSSNPIETKDGTTSSLVLGVENTNQTNDGEKDNGFSEARKISILPIVLILVGVIFIGFSLFSVIRNSKKGYTG